MIPTEVSELIRTKKLFFIGLDAMCGARLGELWTSYVSISLQNTFKQHLWASHWTTCNYIEPCSIASWGLHMIYMAKQIMWPQPVIWCGWVKALCFIYLKHNVLETGFCLQLQIKPTQLGPIDSASPCLRTFRSYSGMFVSGIVLVYSDKHSAVLKNWCCFSSIHYY
jgi:hypothetical protein